MICRRINYSKESYKSTISVEVILSDDMKITEQSINKVLMIAMNYLLENLETTDQEELE